MNFNGKKISHEEYKRIVSASQMSLKKKKKVVPKVINISIKILFYFKERIVSYNKWLNIFTFNIIFS